MLRSARFFSEISFITAILTNLMLLFEPRPIRPFHLFVKSLKGTENIKNPSLDKDQEPKIYASNCAVESAYPI